MIKRFALALLPLLFAGSAQAEQLLENVRIDGVACADGFQPSQIFVFGSERLINLYLSDATCWAFERTFQKELDCGAEVVGSISLDYATDEMLLSRESVPNKDGLPEPFMASALQDLRVSKPGTKCKPDSQPRSESQTGQSLDNEDEEFE